MAQENKCLQDALKTAARFEQFRARYGELIRQGLSKNEFRTNGNHSIEDFVFFDLLVAEIRG